MEQEKKRKVLTPEHKRRVSEGNKALTKVRKIVWGWKAGHSIEDIARLLDDTGEGCMNLVADWLEHRRSGTRPDVTVMKRMNVMPGRGEVCDFVDELRFRKCKRTKRGRNPDWITFFSSGPVDPSSVDLNPVDPHLLEDLVHEVVDEYKAKRLEKEQRSAALIDEAFEKLSIETIEEALDLVIKKLGQSLVLLKQARAEFS
jgi:hypothetical protein